MRFALWSVVLAALAVAIALLAKDSTGYVVIVAAPYRTVTWSKDRLLIGPAPRRS